LALTVEQISKKNSNDASRQKSRRATGAFPHKILFCSEPFLLQYNFGGPIRLSTQPLPCFDNESALTTFPEKTCPHKVLSLAILPSLPLSKQNPLTKLAANASLNTT
jgi:hypothetical protein